MIQGKSITLRIVTQDDLALLSNWTNDFHFTSEYNNFGLRSVNTLEQRFSEDGMISTAYGRLMIETSDGHIAGDMSYRQVGYGPNETSRAYNIGICLAAEYRGHGYGTEAQKLLTAYLFATYPIMRVEALTDRENVPEQRSLEKAGFTRDGIVRQAQWRNGSWHDLVLYSKLRGE